MNMNPFLFTGLVALGVGATITYYLGVKKNRWLGKHLSAQTEEILAPTDTNYVNIGGAIGYNFSYKLKDDWKEAKGTFTFIPRHSLLYMPISFLIRGGDHFYLNLFTDRRLPGEGHLILASHLRKAKIDDIEAMSRKEVELGGKKFVLLWRENRILDKLERIALSFPDPQSLMHFCCYADNKTLFLHLAPKKGIIGDNLSYFVKNAQVFLEK